ncbi:hypothetical protein BD410DRAFT_704575, partial [Rickenella mellea]
HANLWFEDGNIILATSFSVFRVHRGVLSINSPVFADTFSLPQPDTIENTFEGASVVDMCDDDELAHLLHVIYDRRYYRGGSETSFDKISALLRMSTKYQVDDLRNEIISHLALAYPSTLEKYMEAVDPKTQLSLFPSFTGQHFAVAGLARETNANILLPAALWRSSCESMDDILNGIQDLSGSLHRLPETDMRLCV